MRLSNTAESSVHSPTSAFGWTTDPSYLPSLDEVRATEISFEGKEALRQYYVRPWETERFEVWTQEFIAGLSKHILSGVNVAQVEAPMILEVGAGDGRLAGFLGQIIELSDPQASVVATDTEPQQGSAFPVISMDVREALEEYKPNVVISSWMPLGHEWTRDMRAAPTVNEYIIIGVPHMTGSYSTWHGPELGEFIPADLEQLDQQKIGQLSDEAILGYKTITRSFKRQTKARLIPEQ
ncbi:hypothetical protein A3F37_03925 [Candidatus Saccharibacteria bacterium RIFCSPHIGHO2_12_FULL_41_12]|nr:MAG: hypothetical protein A3F37_03925 [Candidatus Saccharibacteria bacterium RIFCSPHIGHO2_12_FULL_41_12]